MKIIDKTLINEIEEVVYDFKKRRLNLNLSQVKFAKLANLSQSIINKLENGKIDPTFSTILKIERALSEQENLSNLNAKEIMVDKILSVDVNTKIAEVMNLMLKEDYSQILVSKNKKIIGCLYENSILSTISKKIDIYSIDVESYIEDLPVIVPLNYSVSDLSYIFSNKKTKFVLVGDLTKIVGIITKSDLFKI